MTAFVAVCVVLAILAALCASMLSARRAGQRLPLLIEQRRNSPSSTPLLEPRTRAAETLELADQLLNEAWTIGLWSKSDDSSDNRRKRQALREAKGALSDARDSLIELQHPLEKDAAALEAFLAPLPDVVTDWMGENPQLDLKIMEARNQLEGIRERLRKT